MEVSTTLDGITHVEETRTEVVEQMPDGQLQDMVQLLPTPQEPLLFDMDLERMHHELHKNRYLTVEDFLDDIRKIVHNAAVRSEDPERLHRAQAMFTAAQVSIQEFDPQFRMECQRMAVRERQRREAFRKNREKEKAEAAAQNGTYAPGTRRSARNNGKGPEITITDPLLLERRLKRQRSNDNGNTPSDDEVGERSTKRMRSHEEDERDPLDVIDRPLSPMPSRSMSVRFADEVNGALVSPAPNGILTAPPSPQPRRSGFDPALLNPASPVEPRNASAIPVVPTDPEDNPFTTPPVIPSSLSQARAPTPEASSSRLDDAPVELPPPTADGDHSMEMSQPSEPQHSESAPQASVEQPMEIERSPTPLPDFHVDEVELDGLKMMLRDSTAALNVEQLEQLRATCLSCVWRHRAQWDRTSLVQELRSTVQEFVQEVSLDDMDDGDAP